MLTHFDKDGNAVMVDVSKKDISHRKAIASGKIKLDKEIISMIKNRDIKKGDVLTVSQIGAIMAAKKTSDLIPLCHPINTTNVVVNFEIKDVYIKAISTVKTDSKTGVEMEALTAVSTALLTIYDMVKAVSKNMIIYDIHLEYKSGGKSGEFTYGS
ncbi:MAG: cyclic pyranopterin monophosphate synthase MoaC [Tissierellia bacterium]|nr:cyclic pyranopterin monophosphate synthase MoaC [Tissierellia bacterium]